MSEKYTKVLDDAIAKTRELASARPDFVYSNPDPDSESCKYIHDGGQPGCIMGHVALEMGWGAEKLANLEFNGVATVLRSLTGDRVDIGVSTEECRKEAWLSQVQTAQDEGNTWSESVARADRWAARLL